MKFEFDRWQQKVASARHNQEAASLLRQHAHESFWTNGGSRSAAWDLSQPNDMAKLANEARSTVRNAIIAEKRRRCELNPPILAKKKSWMPNCEPPLF